MSQRLLRRYNIFLGYGNGRIWHRQAKTTRETRKEVDEVQGRWAQVQAPALRRELQRREAGKVVALVCLASPTATCALEPARLHSCSKFTTPGCKASHEKLENHDMLHTRTLSFAAMTTSQICKKIHSYFLFSWMAQIF